MAKDLSPKYADVFPALLANSCKSSLGWTDERRSEFLAELKEAAGMNANRNKSFWDGLKFLSTQAIGYGKDPYKKVIWGYNPNHLAGPSILKKIDKNKTAFFKVRNILINNPERIHDDSKVCSIKTFGLDAEFVVGNGRGGSTRFFRTMGKHAVNSNCDGSGEETWEHRTPPTDTAEGQVKNLLVLQRYLSKFLKKSGEYINRTLYTCGSHLHVHWHADVSPNKLTSYFSILALLWNTKPYNIDATAIRIENDYGRLEDVRTPNWAEDEDGVNITDCDEGMSMEYRGFTSPDFSSKAQVEHFGLVLHSAEWMLKHLESLPNINVNIPWGPVQYKDCDGCVGDVNIYQVTPQVLEIVKTIKTPAIKDLIKGVKPCAK